jgi:hypothetical protein
MSGNSTPQDQSIDYGFRVRLGMKEEFMTLAGYQAQSHPSFESSLVVLFFKWRPSEMPAIYIYTMACALASS